MLYGLNIFSASKSFCCQCQLQSSVTHLVYDEHDNCLLWRGKILFGGNNTEAWMNGWINEQTWMDWWTDKLMDRSEDGYQVNEWKKQQINRLQYTCD